MVTVDNKLVTVGNILVADDSIIVTIGNKPGNRWKQRKDLLNTLVII